MDCPANSPAAFAQQPLFTIFIPTYNRAHLLPRALASIEAQTYRGFDVVIIDDGSSDGTQELITEWRARTNFSVFYQWQPNQGKHAAHNAALPHLRGQLTVIFDSDDLLVGGALAQLKSHWEAISAAQREHYSGVEGLVSYFDGTLEGTRFPGDVFDSDYIEIRRKYHVQGDKRGCVRSDILRAFPFPQFPGERHVRPSLLWKRIAHQYKTRFINSVIMQVERQPGGLSSNRFRLRTRNPQGFRFYYLEEVNVHGRRDRWQRQWDSCSNYVRYSWHSGLGLAPQARDMQRKWLWLAALPAGTLRFLGDRLRMRRQRAPTP
jgi:glycosyltransferase involved in cell wall biosynthesis